MYLSYTCLCLHKFLDYKHTATHCNTQPHTATHYHTLQHTTRHCNTLPHTAITYLEYTRLYITVNIHYKHTATHCSVQTRCNTLQHAATRCNTLQHAATRCNNVSIIFVSQHTSKCELQTHCNTLQHTATHCNKLHANKCTHTNKHTPLTYTKHTLTPIIICTNTNNLYVCIVCLLVCVHVMVCRVEYIY